MLVDGQAIHDSNFFCLGTYKSHIKYYIKSTSINERNPTLILVLHVIYMHVCMYVCSTM